MPDRETILKLFQDTYYASVDRGDMVKACSAFDENVDFSHLQVWSDSHYPSSGALTMFKSRKQIEAFLTERADKMAAAQIKHSVKDLVLDGNRGALLGQVANPGGVVKPFMVWFELKGGKISLYTLRPI